MNRRGFLGAIAAMAAGAATLDPDRLLWVPGKKLISIPAPLGLQVRVVRTWDAVERMMLFTFDVSRGLPLPLPHPDGVELAMLSHAGASERHIRDSISAWVPRQCRAEALRRAELVQPNCILGFQSALYLP